MKVKPMPKQFWDDWNWAFDHYSELVKKYPDKWVAISNKKIIAASSHLGEVEDEVRVKLVNTDIPVVFIEGEMHVYKG